MIGTVKTLDTPCGRIVSELDAADVPLATAMRGIGILDKNGFVSEYTLISIDVITDPAFKRD